MKSWDKNRGVQSSSCHYRLAEKKAYYFSGEGRFQSHSSLWVEQCSNLEEIDETQQLLNMKDVYFLSQKFQ